MIKQNRIKVGTYLDKEIYKRFQELSDQTKVPLSKLFDEALNDLLKKRKLV